MLSSPVEIAIVFGVGLLLFGPKKLPELGKALGQGIGNFKKSLTDAQSEITTQIKEADRDIAEKNKATAQSSSNSSANSQNIDSSEINKPTSS